jgi:hypothetical protein
MEDIDGIAAGRRGHKKGDPQEGAFDREGMKAESGIPLDFPIETMVFFDNIKNVIVFPVELQEAADEAADIGAVPRAVTLGGVGVDADPHGRVP